MSATRHDYQRRRIYHFWRWVWFGRWRSISEEKFLVGVRKSFVATADKNILAIFHYSRGLVHQTRRYEYRCQLLTEE